MTSLTDDAEARAAQKAQALETEVEHQRQKHIKQLEKQGKVARVPPPKKGDHDPA